MVSRDTGGFVAYGCAWNLEHLDIGNLYATNKQHSHACTVLPQPGHPDAARVSFSRLSLASPERAGFNGGRSVDISIYICLPVHYQSFMWMVYHHM